ncbi:fimbrial protein [Parabacteroides faecis]|uniref:Major fimbrial subunit protein N-terminal domain-containing protein n=1 Tax=Parabacteroides faecis TaxID=1217282 RepID=A0ABR6KQM6_9BACT|nr:fimbrial protein [Parabacteroides faecis]MBB4623678.1 hypothetical protein [Parabacteroides faecis]GGK01992.1 DUF4906 domain-containing protein [Parabacteroides faecis]
MIHSIKNICNLLAGFLLFVSCTDETLIGPKKIIVEEGLPVTTTLTFGTSDPVKIETRVSDISENDQVRSLAVLIFKRDGGSMVKVDNTFFFDADALTMGAVTLKTTTGDRYVYAVANYKSSVFGDLTYQLENVNTLEGLNELCIELEENNTSVLDGQFLMSGYFIGNTESTEKGACCITENGVVDRSGNSGFIDLKRIMSSVKFKVYSNTPGATFIVDSWQVKNIPQRSFVLEQNGECSGMSYDNTNKSSVFVEEDGKKTFSFLMMESKKEAKGSASTRDEREKMSDSSENFDNAPENSTYVILKGTFSGTTEQSVNGDISGREVTAYVTYYIHLGDWGTGGATDYNNYKILRNNRYVYTVNVRGVDDLIVEVQTDSENWSGDGDMLVSTDNAIIFDAHFETTIISFSKKTIRELREKYSPDGTAAGCTLERFKEKFLIYASTPKNSFHPGDDDVNWVTYRRNTEGNVATDFMKYKYSANDKSLLNADGFKTDLYNACDDLTDDNDIVYYTCFIDEYFYGDGNGNYNGAVKLSDFVNQQPRILQICTNYIKNNETSSNSSISTAAYTFSQRSICTMYDMDRMENNDVNGWGTEWTQENPNMKIATNLGERVGWANSLSQGRYNTWGNLSKSFPGFYGQQKAYSWASYLNFATNTLWPDGNKKVYFADFGCLNKNRDLNGNGQIDADELRWYLPAINQYTEYLIGDDVLPEEVTLVNRNKFDHGDIYASSTAHIYAGMADTQVDQRVFLASEGGSTAFANSAGGYKGTVKRYRCIRNLRSVTGGTAALATHSETTLSDGYTYQYLYFDNLNPTAKRASVSHALTFGHTNFDEEARVSDGIEVGDINKTSLTAAEISLINPCASKGEGWRLPNQRELAILTSNRKNEAIDRAATIFSCTKNKYSPNNTNNNSSDRVYLGYSADIAGSMSMWRAGSKASYRCVRDIKK